jgi:hypothetical protein
VRLGLLASAKIMAPDTTGLAMLVPLFKPVRPPGSVDCTELPGAYSLTQAPKLEYDAELSPVVVSASAPTPTVMMSLAELPTTPAGKYRHELSA